MVLAIMLSVAFFIIMLSVNAKCLTLSVVVPTIENSELIESVKWEI
jgi:hypothetical protein